MPKELFTKQNVDSAEPSKEQLERIRELEEKVASLTKEKDEAGLPQRVLLATVPDYSVEVYIVGLKYTTERNEELNRKLKVRMNSGDVLYQYPYTPEMGKDMFIPYHPYMETVYEQYKDFGIVVWDRSSGETKEQATKRGLNEYLKYVSSLKEKLRKNHLEILEKSGSNAVPDESNWDFLYPYEVSHFKRLPAVRDKLKELR